MTWRREAEKRDLFFATALLLTRAAGPCAEDGSCADCPDCAPPRYGLVRTRKQLTRVEYESTEPSYRWEAVYLCESCARAEAEKEAVAPIGRDVQRNLATSY